MDRSNGFIYALQESHLPGIVVCVILVLLSAFSWTVMVTKFLMINRAKRQTLDFLDVFHHSRTPLDPFAESIAYEGSPIYWIYRAGSRELTFQLLGSSQVDESLKARLQRADKISESQMDTVSNAMERAVGEVSLRLENQMTLLATAVSGAPFLGLLGTVWGVMETFSGIASAGGSASLQSMAPGVSAALVTTVIALLVAIPAMFGYNFLINSIKAMIVRMDNYAAELGSAFHRHYVDHGRRFEALPSMTAMGAGNPATESAGSTPTAVPQTRPRAQRKTQPAPHPQLPLEPQAPSPGPAAAAPPATSPLPPGRPPAQTRPGEFTGEPEVKLPSQKPPL